METKFYTNKSNAIRAARNTLKLKEHEYTIEQNEQGFYIALEADKKQEAEKPAKEVKYDAQGRQIIQGHPWVRSSSVIKPTKQVWHIADEMVGATRKEVIAECIKRGIAFFTARTQYQLWLQCQKEMAERESQAVNA
jgi:hypothetical protein